MVDGEHMVLMGMASMTEKPIGLPLHHHDIINGCIEVTNTENLSSTARIHVYLSWEPHKNLP